MYFWPFVIAATHHANVNICSHDHCIYFYFLCSLHFSHIHTSCTMSLRFIVEHRWKCCFNLNECRQTQLVLFVEALTQAQSSAHGRAPCLRTDLAQAVLAPISKIKFCTTLLRLQLAGRASFCCLFSQCVNEAAEPLVSGSHWRAQACSVGLSSELSLQALGNRVLSSAELKLGQVRDTDAFLRRLQGTGLWRLFQIIANYAFILQKVKEGLKVTLQW